MAHPAKSRRTASIPADVDAAHAARNFTVDRRRATNAPTALPTTRNPFPPRRDAGDHGRLDQGLAMPGPRASRPPGAGRRVHGQRRTDATVSKPPRTRDEYGLGRVGRGDWF